MWINKLKNGLSKLLIYSSKTHSLVFDETVFRNDALVSLAVRLHRRQLTRCWHVLVDRTPRSTLADRHILGFATRGAHESLVFRTTPQEARWKEQRHGQRDAAHAEQNQAKQTTRLKIGVERDSVAVDDVNVFCSRLHNDVMRRNQEANENGERAEDEEVSADPDEDLPHERRAAAFARARVGKEEAQLVFVDARVFVDIAVVEVVEVGANSESFRCHLLIDATQRRTSCQPFLLTCFRDLTIRLRRLFR